LLLLFVTVTDASCSVVLLDGTVNKLVLELPASMTEFWLGVIGACPPFSILPSPSKAPLSTSSIPWKI
jgi:hypothetical protein